MMTMSLARRIRNTRGGRARAVLALVVASAPILVSEAQAGARRFTFIYEATPSEAGTIEYEQWITWKTDKDADRNFNRIDFRHELEFGVTDKLQLSVYVVDWRYESGKGVEFHDVAFEAIYNLSDPVTQTLGAAVYGEVKAGPELFELEGKLILQLNPGKWIVAYNATIEAEWEGAGLGERKGVVEQSLGASYQIQPSLTAGVELVSSIEIKDWSQWQDPVFYCGPNLSYRHANWWVTVTPMFQVTDVASQVNYQVRLIFGIGF